MVYLVDIVTIQVGSTYSLHIAQKTKLYPIFQRIGHF